MSLEVLQKAAGIPAEVDPTHKYIYRSGEYGVMYSYWYQDRAENYWKYTNAPKDSPDHDPDIGIPILVPNQPLPNTAPEFFTAEGYKRNTAVPNGTEPLQNVNYNPADAGNVWYESYKSEDGILTFVYLDKDVKESLDLYTQNQLRLVDVGITRYRTFSSNMFQSAHPRDRVTAAILILVDQGYYGVEELLAAEVGDLQFIDKTISLLGRKFNCDEFFYDFLTTLKTERHDSETLFVVDSVHGRNPVGAHTIYSTFDFLRVSPKFLASWHATNSFSIIASRLALQKVPFKGAEDKIFAELAAKFSSTKEVRYLVDYVVRQQVMGKYEDLSVQKSIARMAGDTFGVPYIISDLVEKTDDEKQFSKWLHTQPMHAISELEQEFVDAELAAQEEQQLAEENPEEEKSVAPDV